jgi:hypothetical protein
MRKLSILSPIHDEYFETNIEPILEKGYRPSIDEGFKLYSKAFLAAKGVNSILEIADDSYETQPYDSHPSLRQLISSLPEEGMLKDRPLSDLPATELLHSPESIEAEIIEVLYTRDANRLEPVAWKDVGKTVWREIWLE